MNAIFSKKKPSVEGILTGIRNLKPNRPMKYPYTYTAKIVQFPYKYYFKNNTTWKYYPFGILVSMPIFMYISRLANSPSNVKLWKEKRRLEKLEHHHK